MRCTSRFIQTLVPIVSTEWPAQIQSSSNPSAGPGILNSTGQFTHKIRVEIAPGQWIVCDMGLLRTFHCSGSNVCLGRADVASLELSGVSGLDFYHDVPSFLFMLSGCPF